MLFLNSGLLYGSPFHCLYKYFSEYYKGNKCTIVLVKFANECVRSQEEKHCGNLGLNETVDN